MLLKEAKKILKNNGYKLVESNTSPMTIDDVIEEVNGYTRYYMEADPSNSEYTLYSKETDEEIETADYEESEEGILLAGVPYEKWITALDD